MICDICGADTYWVDKCQSCRSSIGTASLHSLSESQLEKQALMIIKLCNSGRGDSVLQEELKSIRNEQRNRKGRV